jgi:hypothetical protein
VGPRAGLDAVEKIKISSQPGLEPRPFDEPLYRLQVSMGQCIIKHLGLYFYKDKTKGNSVRVKLSYKCTCRFINQNSQHIVTHCVGFEVVTAVVMSSWINAL